MVSLTSPIRALFLHHSVGRHLVREGKVRERLASRSSEPCVKLWDHDYNKIGLTNEDGDICGCSFPMPEDNTNPDGFLRLFTSELSDVEESLRKVLDFDIIVMKSCYPNSAIRSEQALEGLMLCYRKLFENLQTRADCQFVLLTTPPLVPMRTNRRQACRAMKLAGWLAELPQDLAIANIEVMDLFSHLAEETGSRAGILRAEYRRRIPLDAHPNTKANKIVGPLFVDALIRAARRTELSLRYGVVGADGGLGDGPK
jgi:hypothetical protein